jgi:phage tail-like protein
MGLTTAKPCEPAVEMGPFERQVTSQEVQQMVEPATTAKPTGLNVVRIVLTIDDKNTPFSDVVQISSEVESVEMMESTSKEALASAQMGRRRPPTVTLRRTMRADMSMAGWHEAACRRDLTAMKSGALTMFDAEGKPVVKYALEAAWPSKIEIRSIGDTSAGTNLSETVTLVARDIRRVAPG